MDALDSSRVFIQNNGEEGWTVNLPSVGCIQGLRREDAWDLFLGEEAKAMGWQ